MDDIPLRYTIPTRLDSAPTGTIARVSKEENIEELFIQVGVFEAPQWIRIGTFLESVFKNRYTDKEFKEFIEHCLQIFNNQEPKT